jgi:hypothetical protein
MDYKIDEIDLERIFDKLNIELPSNLCFLPENIGSANNKDEFIFSDSISDLNKVFRQNKIDFSTLGGEANLLRSRKNADLFVPAFFFSLSLITENPTIVSVSLSILANYITDFFKGSFGRKKVNFEIYIESNGKKRIKKITYNGDVEGIGNLESVIKSLNK